MSESSEETKSPRSLSISGRLLALLGLLFITVVGVIWHYYFKPRDFPVLQAGSYVGVIEDFPFSTKSSSVTMLMQKFENRDNLLVAIFVDGWTPQLVKLKPLQNENSDSTTEGGSSYEPVQVRFSKAELGFTGKNVDGGVKGEVAFSSGEKRQFSLSLGSLKEGGGQAGSSMNNWVKAKAEYWETQSMLQEISRRENQSNKDLKKLDHFLNNKERLKQVAEEEKGRLENEIKSLQEDEKSNKNKLRSLVRDLEVLGRISERGKTVRLIRRISNRENRWYMANWGEDIDGDSLPSFITRDRSVDLGTLDQEYKGSLEIAKLQRLLRKEQRALKNLKNEYQRKLAPVQSILPTAGGSSGSAPKKRNLMW